MPRLTAQADMEYFPSYVPTMLALKDIFTYDSVPETLHAIDTSAGGGEALKALTDGIRRGYEERHGRALGKSGIKTFGIELHTERAAAARKMLNRVIQADFNNTIVSEGSFHLMLLNPPYDYDAAYKRLEQRFLVRSTRLLSYGGILIYMVPRYVLNISAEFLAQNYSHFRIWQEQENPDAERFNQVMLVARRDSHPYDPDRNEQEIRDFADGKTDEVGIDNKFALPVGNLEVERFTALRVDYGDVLKEVALSGFASKQEWRDMLHPPMNDVVQPLMSPRKGHMGLIMAGGGVGGLGIPVFSEGDEENRPDAKIFRASAKKITQSTPVNDSGTALRLTERMSSTAVTLDPLSWQFTDNVGLGQFVTQFSQELASYLAEVMPPKYTPEALREKLGGPPRYGELLRKPMPGNGQRLTIEGTMFSLLDEERGTAVVGEMGTGKTFCSMAAAHLAGYRRVCVLGPPTLVWKWEDEVLKTIRNARVFVIGKNPGGKKAKEPFYQLYKNPMKQLRWLNEHYGNGNNADIPVYVIVAHSTAKQSYGRIPAINWRWGYRTQTQYGEVSGETIEPRWVPFAEQVEVPYEAEDGTIQHKVVREYRKQMCCPECGQPVMGPKDAYAEWNWLANRRRSCNARVTVGRLEFTDEQGRPAYAAETRECGNPLWQALARSYVSNMEGSSPHGDEDLKARIRRETIYAYGVDAEQARNLYEGAGSRHPDYVEDEWAAAIVDKLEIFKSKSHPPRRFDLAEYYKRYGGDFFELLIADEFHQFKAGDSAQGQMARMLAEVIPQCIVLTGTLMSGYARDLFHLLYGFAGREVREEFEHNHQTRWRNMFGFVERTVYLDAENAKRSRTRRQDERPRDLPGAMPSVLRYILGNSVFIRLLDVAAGLPDFSEHAITVELDEERDPETGFSQQENYKLMEERILREIKSLTYQNPRAAAQLVSIFAQAVLTYPDACTQEESCLVYHPVDGHPIIDRPALPADKLYPKEEKLLEIVKAEKEAGRKVLVFATHTNRRDMLPRLHEIMERAEIRATVMRTGSPDADKRMPWLQERLKEGLDVLICHPQLVETGVDMLDFPTIIWWEADYNTARVRQASRRSWRIGQTEPVRIYYLTYGDTKQTQALYLIAQKVATSLAVEGDLSNNGLTSMAGGDNMGRSIAQMLVDSDITFDGSFEAGINIAALAEDAEGEELLADYEMDFDAEDAANALAAEIIEAIVPELGAVEPAMDGLTPEDAVSLVTQTLIPAPEGVVVSEPKYATDGVAVPLFGTTEGGAALLEVCDQCEQFIVPTEQRVKTPDGRVFHTDGAEQDCYAVWGATLTAAADEGEIPEVAEPVNDPKPTPNPAADVPDPADFGAVSMDAWMSAFGLEEEDLERGKRKRTRKSRKQKDEEARQGTLIAL